jgi:molybdopterin adenylyltransferase
MNLEAKVLTVSDGVFHGVREDRSGVALSEYLVTAGYVVLELRVVADGVESVSSGLADLSEGFAGLIVTTGGTGFGPRDNTPEGTLAVLDRQAPGMAEAMRNINPPMARLSRGVAGTRGHALILNTPGSPKGCVECLSAVLDAVPHALSLMTGETTIH